MLAFIQLNDDFQNKEGRPARGIEEFQLQILVTQRFVCAGNAPAVTFDYGADPASCIGQDEVHSRQGNPVPLQVKYLSVVSPVIVERPVKAAVTDLMLRLHALDQLALGAEWPVQILPLDIPRSAPCKQV